MYGKNPFGNPDGARADINEINEVFIADAPNAIDFSVLPDSLLNMRVIVGAKGTGKTVYLRKIQALLKNREEDLRTGIYVDDTLQQNLNCTERVITFCDYFQENVLSEKWTQLWKVTLWTALALKYVNDPELQSYINAEDKQELIQILKNQNMMFAFAPAAYDLFKTLLMHINSAYDVSQKIDHIDWLNLKRILEKTLKVSPVIYIFLDSIDIEYEHAPMHWTACQKGLFYAVMDMLQERVWGERYHILISIRSNVFASVLRSEHSTKFADESHIYFLNWNYTNIKYFICEKIKKLDDCYFINPNSDKNLTSWLSIDSIINDDGNSELLLDYIAKHTRFVPRDAIIMCNNLATMHHIVANDSSVDIPTKIREIVKQCSQTFGDELLTICAKNITANQAPNGSGHYQYSENFTACDAYQEGSYHRLKSALAIVKGSYLNYDELVALEYDVDQKLGVKTYLPDILWQNGAIGYIDKDGLEKYYTQKANIDQLIPKGKSRYVFKTCIMDALSIKTTR